jgi:uncharacterized repeat protein (TIGR03803 family)
VKPRPTWTTLQGSVNSTVAERIYAMKPELKPITGRHPSTVMQSAKETCKQWGPWAIALAILLGLATVPPSAHGQTFTVLHSFKGGTDGESPVAGLVRDAAGNLYGTTEYGGGGTCFTGDGCGTVFKVDTTGKETVLHSFTGGADGAFPLAGLILDEAGNLYGTTEYGGNLACNSGVGCGTVFKMDPTGKETVLYSFTGKEDISYRGRDPGCGGQLYGTTPQGGAFAWNRCSSWIRPARRPCCTPSRAEGAERTGPTPTEF